MAALLTGCASSRADPWRGAAQPVPGEYSVVDGRVDAGTYSGWRVFHSSCFGCHGVGGSGTDIAPDLVDRIRAYTPRGFATKVLTSYRIVPMTPGTSAAERDEERRALVEDVLRRDRAARGMIVMPAWDQDPTVQPHVLDLYAYLSARADGALGPGRPLRSSPRAR